MSEEKIVSFKTGDIKNLDALPKSEGQVLFSIDGTEGVIYFDKDANTRTKMNPDATKLNTNKTIITNLDSTSAMAYTGENNIEIGVKGVLDLNHGGTGGNTVLTALQGIGIRYGATEPSNPVEGMIWLCPQGEQTPLTIEEGGTNASTASGARTNLNVYSKNEVDTKLANLDVSLPISYGTSDLVAGESYLSPGSFYFVYE